MKWENTNTAALPTKKAESTLGSWSQELWKTLRKHSFNEWFNQDMLKNLSKFSANNWKLIRQAIRHQTNENYKLIIT